MEQWEKPACSSRTRLARSPKSTFPPCSTTIAPKSEWTAAPSASICGTQRARRSMTASARCPTLRPTSSSSASPSPAPRPTRTSSTTHPSCWWGPRAIFAMTRMC
ncbi:hypothetical protein PO909_008277 [Leuciscus waleckii]